jgi:hypothetical protein
MHVGRGSFVKGGRNGVPRSGVGLGRFGLEWGGLGPDWRMQTHLDWIGLSGLDWIESNTYELKD